MSFAANEAHLKAELKNAYICNSPYAHKTLQENGRCPLPQKVHRNCGCAGFQRDLRAGIPIALSAANEAGTGCFGSAPGDC
jgi:hypothetical protein